MGLIGREAEQSAIASLISDSREGRSGVLTLVGEPGMGKSALLEHGVGLATQMNVLRASGVQSEALIPFAGLSELLRPALRHLDRIPPHQAAALEGALALVPARAEERFAVSAATLSLLAAFADDAPVLVVIDDAQWLDGSSADALSFALRRLIADPVAVLLGVRAGQPWLLDRSDLPRRRLEGLARHDAAALLSDIAGTVPPDLVDRLHRHTGGNPLALIEAARQIDRFRHDAPLDVPLPFITRVQETYVATIRGLDERCRMMLLLGAASDIGEVTVLARAASELGLTTEDIGAAEDAQLVDVRGGRIEFRHPLIRSAVYADASPQERRRAHKALADTLPDADPDRRAWHLALATVGPDDPACSALEQAGRRGRARSAYDVASRAFERAAQLAPEENRRVRLLYDAAQAAWDAGQGGRTNDLLDVARAAATEPDVGIAIDHLRGRAAARLGPVSDGLHILMDAAARASQDDPEGAAVVLAEAVNAAFYAGDPATMRAAAEQIAAIEPRLRGERTRLFATMARGMALAFSGQPETGAALLRRAVDLASREIESADDPTWLTWAAMGTLWLRESNAGRAFIERATDVARSRAAIGVLPLLLGQVAIDHATTHRWAEAEATFHEAIALSAETHQRTDRAACLARLAWLESRQGKEPDCLDHAHEAIRLADELGLMTCKVWALAALGDLYLGQGKTTEAIDVLNAQRELLAVTGIADVDISPAPELVELHAASGDTETATALADEYQRQARDKGQPWALARAARCRGILADDELLDAIFSGALEEHGRTPDRFETARTLLAYGTRLRRARQRVRSREQLQAALDIFDALGAHPWSAKARAELAASGITARRRDDSTRTVLTPQELQIALLLAGSHTTKQAAAALFLSPKTVEFHLRNVYRKLGCNTREELASTLNAVSAGGPAGHAGL
jgi:DNA-binding CsgD family transcriptional regulator